MSLRNPHDYHGQFAQAFNSQNLDAILDLYEQAATVFPQPNQSVTGHEQIRAALEHFLATRGVMDIHTEYVIINEPLALCRASWKIRGSTPDGAPTTIESRSIEVLRRQSDNSWKVIIDHPYGAG